MSESFDRGRNYERHIRKVTKGILKIDVERDKQSGAGIHKQDVRDRYSLLPIFIECKDQKALNVKKEWRISEGKSSVGEAPLVVFPDNEVDLCVMSYTDLLQLIREMWDWKETAEDLRRPQVELDTPVASKARRSSKRPTGDSAAALVPDLHKAVGGRVDSGGSLCGNGHLIDQYGYCMGKKCKYARGYKAPKVRK